jgi:hypothetical protein
MKADSLSSKLSVLVMPAVLLLAPLTAKAEGPTRLNSVSVLTQVRDSSCNPADQTAGMITSATPLNTPLYEFLQCHPVLAPDGHQLTLGEFKAAEGSISAKCTGQGTHSVIHFSGLVPNGTYTVWLFIFGNGGPPANPTSVSPLGKSDPIQNFFTASASGEGQLSVTTPGACWLDAPEVHLAVVYHIDGQTHGSTPGPAGTWAFQAGFAFL